MFFSLLLVFLQALLLLLHSLDGCSNIEVPRYQPFAVLTFVIPILGEKYLESTPAPTNALLNHYIREAEALTQSEGEEKEGAVEEQLETMKVLEEILGLMCGRSEDQEEEMYELQELALEELGELWRWHRRWII
ncbi:uncharacterized protein LACBIDRAFT_334781 [Laccaria bicolor S238N-H82]|uniref:Predicted protein n=1 Tax=Laccaria bicolor (strain S238N-H82 / ATCC MYA-4686) TaxID=486041 RepID=B0E0A5_LACBS|nr:uncharacterized protein LACBIDRAFT_334781 [Laccaria bicolor S238N-H82]EDQ99789.1 predicted protein [Laccaria bicolor S238N-H82]|eukprot:XP_001889625.1 predicted protein [Laccaria bicolor S238N-H82]